MQTVNILSDHSLDLALFLKFRKRFVACIRLRIFIDQFVLVKLIEVFGVSDVKRMRDHLFRGYFASEILIIKAIGAPEIRNTALS